MRAALLHEHGGVPTWGEIPEPEPQPEHTLIDVLAAPIAPLDLLCASGTSYFGAPELPYAPGVQGVGRVISSETFAEGTLVWFPTVAGMTGPGWVTHGALVDHALVKDSDVVTVPDVLPAVEAAALGLNAVAALRSLINTAEMKPGETVLVLGGGSAVGQAAQSIAKYRGAGRVVGVCRSERAHRLALESGADAVVTVPDPGGDLPRAIREACHGEPDVVIDLLCGEVAEAALKSMRPRGRFVNIGSSSGQPMRVESPLLRSRELRIMGYTNVAPTAEERAVSLREVFAMAVVGGVHIDHAVVPADQVEAAWRSVADGSAPHRVILDLSESRV